MSVCVCVFRCVGEVNFDIILDFKTCIHTQQCAVKTGVIVSENGPPMHQHRQQHKWFIDSEQVCFIKSKQDMLFVGNKDISKWLKTFRSIQKCFKHSRTLKVGTNEPHTKPQTCRRSHYFEHVHLIVSPVKLLSALNHRDNVFVVYHSMGLAHF